MEQEPNYSLLEAIAAIGYEAGRLDFRPMDSGTTSDLIIEWAKEFEEKHKDTQWGYGLEYPRVRGHLQVPRHL